MKLTCLVDNAVVPGAPLWGEHGLAFLVESGGRRVLFDTGQSGSVLLHNMDALKIAPESIDALAISHAHYDHTGGLEALLARARPDLPLYAHPELPRERFSQHEGRLRSIGLPLPWQTLAARTTLHLSDRPQQILPGVWTSGEIAPRPEPEGRASHQYVFDGEVQAADPYRDDLALILETADGLVLLCGCCHAGLLNTLAHVERTFGRPVVLIAGGSHLVSADAAHLARVSEVLGAAKSLRRVYLNHCTGEAGLFSLLLELGPQVVHTCPAGTRIDLDPAGQEVAP